MIRFTHFAGSEDCELADAFDELLRALLEEGFAIADADRHCVMISKEQWYASFEGLPVPMLLLTSVAEFQTDAYADGDSAASVRSRVAGWFQGLALGQSAQEFDRALAGAFGETMRPGDVVRCAALASLGVADPAAVSGALAAPPSLFRRAAVAAVTSRDPGEHFRGFN
jgi:hypothetical protein